MNSFIYLSFLIGTHNIIGNSGLQGLVGSQQNSVCDVNTIVNGGDVFEFSDSVHDEPEIVPEKSQTEKSPSFFKWPYPIEMEGYQDSQADSPPRISDLSSIAQYDQPKETESHSFQENVAHFNGNGIKNSYEYEDVSRMPQGLSHFQLPLDSDPRSRDLYGNRRHSSAFPSSKLIPIDPRNYLPSDSDGIPKLFSEYFKKSESEKENSFGSDMPGGRNYRKKNLKKSEVNIFTLMNKPGINDRKRRSVGIREAFRHFLLTKGSKESRMEDSNISRCSWKYSAGPSCHNFVVHMLSGDASNMDCDAEFLRFNGDAPDSRVQYCGGTRIPKTTVHGKELLIEHVKKLGTVGQGFRGYVVCSSSQIL